MAGLPAGVLTEITEYAAGFRSMDTAGQSRAALEDRVLHLVRNTPSGGTRLCVAAAVLPSKRRSTSFYPNALWNGEPRRGHRVRLFVPRHKIRRGIPVD